MRTIRPAEVTKANSPRAVVRTAPITASCLARGPSTGMGSAVLDDERHMVASNDCEAVRGATRYLIDQGHRRIGLVAGPHGFRSARERRLGFEEALERAGISAERLCEYADQLAAHPDYPHDKDVAGVVKYLDQLGVLDQIPGRDGPAVGMPVHLLHQWIRSNWSTNIKA